MTSMSLDQGLMDAYQHLSDGTAIDRTFETTVNDVGSHIDEVQGKISAFPSQINGIESGIMSSISGIQSNITASLNRIPDFAAHVTNKLDNVMNDINTFASSQGLSNALAGKSSGCSNMLDFFGSITTKGPQLISEVTGLANSISQEFDNFTSLAGTLQTNITSTYSGMISQLTSEITAAGSDSAKVASLTSLKQNVISNFQTGVSDVRADLTRQVQSAISSERKAVLDPLITEMRNTDFSILSSSKLIGQKAGSIDSKTGSFADIISGETSAVTQAVTQLEYLGAASSMQSLAKTNDCVQTLLGFVGTDNFLKSLGS